MRSSAGAGGARRSLTRGSRRRWPTPRSSWPGVTLRGAAAVCGRRESGAEVISRSALDVLGLERGSAPDPAARHAGPGRGPRAATPPRCAWRSTPARARAGCGRVREASASRKFRLGLPRQVIQRERDLLVVLPDGERANIRPWRAFLLRLPAVGLQSTGKVRRLSPQRRPQHSVIALLCLSGCLGHAKTVVDGYSSAVEGLTGERSAEGGLLPHGAVGAEVVDRADRRHRATTVRRPRPDGWAREPGLDYRERCPACGNLAWERIRAPDGPAGMRWAGDRDPQTLTPARLAERAPEDEGGARAPPRTRLNSLV